MMLTMANRDATIKFHREKGGGKIFLKNLLTNM